MLIETPMNSISTNRWTHWDPLKYYSCTVDHAQLLRCTFFYLFSLPSHFSVGILFRLPHFARVISFKKNRATAPPSAPWTHCETEGSFGDSRKNFTRRLTVVNFPCTDWLSYLRTQLRALVGGVCLRGRRFFWALFSGINFFVEADTLKSYNSKGICSVALKFEQ